DLRIKTIVPDAVEVERPFVGLSGFLEDTSEFYFGREGELAKALERLRATPSLAIVGASGVGKTSFVRAGISAQLRARGWATICVRPSREPFRGLARALCDYANGSRELDRNYVEQLAEQLKDPDEKALAASLHRLVTFTQTAICLIVDQLDELYTHSDNKVQHAFLATLLTATDDATDRVRIVLSLRDDFMGKAVGLENVMILEPLGDADIRKVLKEPLRRVGYSFEDEALIDEIVKDVEATDVGLPFLQFTCEKLWDHRDRDQRVLLRRAYKQFGGVEGAIADQGNKVLRALTSSKQLVARKLLIRLVTPQDTRRVMPRGELLDRLGPDASDVLLELINARLLATRVPIGEDEPTIELAHEALIRRWKQLAKWLEEERDDRVLQEQLSEAAQMWKKLGRSGEGTWTEDKIKDARSQLAQYQSTVPHLVEQFLEAGEVRAKREQSRKRWMIMSVIFIVVLIVGSAVSVALRLKHDNLVLREARLDLGHFRLALQPFDWDPERLTIKKVSADRFPSLDWKLYRLVSRSDARPGQPFARLISERLPDSLSSSGVALFDVYAPGSRAMLEIKGRGRPGQSCASSWLRLDSLPGFSDRGSLPTFIVPVPTCQASKAGMRPVFDGPFIWGGAGEPKSPNMETASPKERRFLPMFWLDRTEVSNAAFRIFASTASVSGYPVPRFPASGIRWSLGRPEMPVSSIDASTAAAFCRYFGKRLPRSEEWVKAVRGLDDGLNPHPERLFPWGPDFDRALLNVDGLGDVYFLSAPVSAFSSNAGPFGHINLVGNVDEWMADDQWLTHHDSARAIRGGSWSSPGHLFHFTSVYENAREPRFFSFSIGMRCAADGSAL
ncbi:MAG: SUMF1/EgtB/PvdO family nonheme iron enzyme, partial [Myxococcota bacterium]